MKTTSTDTLDSPVSKQTGASTEISSEQLLGHKKEISIRHNGERYTLRITANNKMILTK